MPLNLTIKKLQLAIRDFFSSVLSYCKIAFITQDYTIFRFLTPSLFNRYAGNGVSSIMEGKSPTSSAHSPISPLL